MRPLSLLFIVAGLLLSVVSATAQGSGRPVLVGEIEGIINPVMAGYVDRVLDEAEQLNAEAVVFTMDTPGGLVDSTREINQRILASSVPVIVYVAPNGARAGSAGAFITYAAHLAAMAPATNIGSATPVSLGEQGEQQLSDEMRAKITNDAVAQIRALAEQRGRNPDFAEQAVREGANLQASEALQQDVVNYVAADLDDLLRQAHGARVQLATGEATLNTAGAPVERAEMSAVEQFLLIITNPTIAYILLSLGSLGLMLEFYNPGSIFPGVLGGISLLLAFYALGTLPVNFAGLALIVFGILLFALEPFVASGGMLAIGGAIAFTLGSLMLVNVPESAEFLQVSVAAIAAMTGTMLAFFLLAAGAIVRGQRRQVATGREGLVGRTATARTEVLPGREGMVFVQGELWRAVSVGHPIAPGERAVVESVDRDNLLVRVRPETVPPASGKLPPGPPSIRAGRIVQWPQWSPIQRVQRLLHRAMAR